jgi:GT2 family glycosyltransferase
MSSAPDQADTPSVSIVFLVFNRRDELRESLRRMLRESGYPRGHIEVIVVDNASTDGSAEMVRNEFQEARVIASDRNVGVSGFNLGLAAATGDWVLALDDDCYLSPDGLGRAIAAAGERQADLVSFKVISTEDPSFAFTDSYKTGLFSFWGCAVLMRRQVIEALGGYDPEIFVWANELDFMLRFFDRGFRHLHLPEVVAHHMKAPPPVDVPSSDADWRPHFYNCRHFGYIAAKQLQPRDAAEALVALLVGALITTVRVWRGAAPGIWHTVAGFAHGLRNRRPVGPRVSRFYRHNFESFASPWWFWRSPRERMSRRLNEGEAVTDPRVAELKAASRRKRFFLERSRFYPDSDAVLDFRDCAGLRPCARPAARPAP